MTEAFILQNLTASCLVTIFHRPFERFGRDLHSDGVGILDVTLTIRGFSLRKI